MVDEPSSDESNGVEPSTDSGGMAQQTAGNTTEALKEEEESKQLDENQPVQSAAADAVQEAVAGESSTTEPQQPPSEPSGEGAQEATEVVEEVKTGQAGAHQTDQAESSREQQAVPGEAEADDSEAHSACEEVALVAEQLTASSEEPSDVETEPTLPAPECAHTDAVPAESPTTPEPAPNSELSPSQSEHLMPPSSTADTDSSNADDATHPISLDSSQPVDPSISDTHLVATLPSAFSSLPPAVIPRESTIQVRLLLTGADESLLVSVHILREYLSQPKPFLGGYRHHVSGRIKHHASVQTERRQTGKGSGSARVTRDTQTVETATRSAQSGRSVGTQMARADYFIGEEGETGQGERVVEAGESVSSEVLEAEREERAKQIQCWLRVCFAVRRMKQLKAAKDATLSSSRRETAALAERARCEEEAQIHRRMHPKSRSDFALLYAELNAWRQHEAARIHTLALSDDERDAQLNALLSKEVKLLQTIDRLKIRASRERKEEGIHRRLEKMQSPKEWTTSAGHHVEVVTPYTVRAQELTSLYQALLLPVQMHAQEEKTEEGSVSTAGGGCVTWEGRVDVLLHCKYVVGEMASQLSTDVVQLIEREQEWVRRRQATPGWQAEQALAGMRRRLAALFLQFVQTPAYNPEAAVYVDSVGRDGKRRMQELLNKPLAEREVRKMRPMDAGQDRTITATVQT